MITETYLYERIGCRSLHKLDVFEVQVKDKFIWQLLQGRSERL